MTFNRHNLALLLGAAVAFLATASPSEAGFVSARIDDGPAAAAFAADHAGAGAASAPAENQQSPRRPWQIELPTDYLDAFLSPGGPAGGMSTTSSGSGPSSPPAAVPIENGSPTPALVLRVGRHEPPFHPRFIKSRLFRPPRS